MRNRLLALCMLLPLSAWAQAPTTPPATGYVQALGGDASAAVRLAAGGMTTRTFSAAAADEVNVMEFNAVGDALNVLTSAAQSAAGNTLQVASADGAKLAVGFNAACINGLAPTTITALATSGNITTVTVGTNTVAPLPAGFACIFAKTDNTTPFANAQAAAQARGGMQLRVPSGNYFKSGVTYSISTDGWTLDAGAAFPYQGIDAITDTPNNAMRSIGLATTTVPNQEVMFLSALINAAGGTGNNEKIGLYEKLLTADPSTYTTGTLSDNLTVARDVTGIEDDLATTGSNMTARLYAAHLQTSFGSGTDGNGTLLEAELLNNGTYTPQVAKAASKRILHLTCIGTVDCTDGIQVDGAAGGGTGRFHIAYSTYSAGLRADGWAFALWPSAQTDMTSTPTTGIGQDGHIVSSAPTTLSRYATATLTASQTLTSAQCGQRLWVNSSSNVTLMMGAFPPGCEIEAIQQGAGTVAIAAGSGLTALVSGTGAATTNPGDSERVTVSPTPNTFQVEGISAPVANIPPPTAVGTSTYQITAADCTSGLKQINSTTANVVTFPSGLPLVCRVNVEQGAAAGSVQIVPGNGMTLPANPNGVYVGGPGLFTQVWLASSTEIAVN